MPPIGYKLGYWLCHSSYGVIVIGKRRQSGYTVSTVYCGVHGSVTTIYSRSRSMDTM
jgi:hypothetical protein